MGFGKNLQKIRKFRGVTQGGLADLVALECGDGRGDRINQATISKIEVSDAGSSEYVVEIARALRVTVENLFDPVFVERLITGGLASSDNLITRPGLAVPVYSAQKLFVQGCPTMPAPAEFYESSAYWVKIDDDSCMPHYPSDSRFLISPTTKPTPGCLVLAALANGSNAVMIYRKPTLAGYTLCSVNGNYADYAITDDANRDLIHGAVVYVAAPPIRF